jgi:hypothetical protein
MTGIDWAGATFQRGAANSGTVPGKNASDACLGSFSL